MVKSRKKQKINSKVSEIGIKILSFVAVSGFIVTAAILPGVSILVAPLLRSKKYSHKQAIQRTVESLIARGLLAHGKDDNGNQILFITKKGQWELGIRGYFGNEKSNSVPPKHWDDIWRMIIFDVPESKRSVRSELRRAVKLYGFVQLQQSVWVYPYPCDDFVSLVKSHLGISHDVLYLTSNYLENDKWLRKQFKV